MRAGGITNVRWFGLGRVARVCARAIIMTTKSISNVGTKRMKQRVVSILSVVLIAQAFAAAGAPKQDSFSLPDKASPELAWWRDSMKTHDERIGWWREARFGMFVHWGVYSTLGNEYKGRQGGGYAEHIQRVLKIS